MYSYCTNKSGLFVFKEYSYNRQYTKWVNNEYGKRFRSSKVAFRYHCSMMMIGF